MIALFALLGAADPDPGFVGPLPPVEAPLPPPPSPTELLPALPHESLGHVVLLALVAAGLALAATGLRALAGDLRPTGVLPTALRVLEVASRAGTALAVVAAGLALVPSALQPLVPWVGVAVALAVGWSARDALPDLVAWAFLAAEGRLRPGTWVRGATFEGVVVAHRARLLWLVDRRGERVAVPNRQVAAEPLRTDPSGCPEVEVAVDLPGDAGTARRALREAVLLSPWLAPGEPVIEPDPRVAGRWIVRVRVVDLRWADRFAGTFPERAREAQGPLPSSRPPL